MTEEQERKIETFYEDSFVLSSTYNTSVRLKKVCVEKSTKKNDKYKVEVYLDDNNNQTTQLLGFYYDAKWKFTIPMYESIFWKMVKDKKNTKRFRTIFDRLRIKDIGSENTGGKMFFRLMYDNMKRRRKIRKERKRRRK